MLLNRAQLGSGALDVLAIEPAEGCNQKQDKCCRVPHSSRLLAWVGKLLTADGNGKTYTYNADGMITASGGATYVYDGLNQRVEKTGGSNPTETIYFGGLPIALLNPSSGAWTDLIYAGSSMIAEVAGTQAALPTYRHLDHLGSLALQTNNSGAVTGSNVFLPFGDLLSSTTSDVFQYTGLPQDTENSSDHATYRSLSTTQSRWLSPDPYNGSYDITNPQSFNRYVYAMNNPLAYVDPSGLNYTDENGNIMGSSGGETMTEGDGTVIVWDPTTNMWVGPGSSPAPVPDPGPTYIGDFINPYPTTTGISIGGGANGVGTATSSGPNYTRAQVCAASALSKGGGQTALDAVGMIPGNNTILRAFQIGTGILSAGISAYNNSPPADGFLASVGVGLTAAKSYSTNIAFRGTEILPIFGNGFAAVSTKRDLNAMGKEFDSCMGGS